MVTAGEDSDVAAVGGARRAALVLGGSGGIGLAIARMLAEEGYALTLQGRGPERVEAAVEVLVGERAADGPLITGVAADLGEEGEIKRVVETHRERHGRLDVLVNSAGLGSGQPLEEISAKRLDLQTSVNFRAAVLVMRECVPLLREAGAEHGKALIVNVSSWAGKHGQPWLSVYGATKAAMVNFTEAAQKELAGTGIQATALCPSTVETEMTRYAQGEISPEEMLRPEDLAEAVRFLLRTSPACLIPEIILGRASDT